MGKALALRVDCLQGLTKPNTSRQGAMSYTPRAPPARKNDAQRGEVGIAVEALPPALGRGDTRHGVVSAVGVPPL
eukprot:1147863-Pelagomonas_calceolata.AAC.2